MADPTTAGGGTEGLRFDLAQTLFVRLCPYADAESAVRLWDAPECYGYRNTALRFADALLTGPLACVSAEQARVEAEVGRLKSDKALLLDVIEDARAEADLAWADEAEGVADFRTRKVRSASMRDALNGVGSPEKRQALGFSVLKLPEPPDA